MLMRTNLRSEKEETLVFYFPFEMNQIIPVQWTSAGEPAYAASKVQIQRANKENERLHETGMNGTTGSFFLVDHEDSASAPSAVLGSWLDAGMILEQTATAGQSLYSLTRGSV
jgi:hypothetical protein